MAVQVEAQLHVAIVTRDADRLARFYTDLFGGDVVRRLSLSSPEFAAGVGVPGAKARTLHVTVPGTSTVIELTEYDEVVGPDHRGPVNTPGWSHVAFRVRSVGDAARRLRAIGSDVVGDGPVEVPAPPEAKGTRFLYLRDPDGNVVELIQPPGRSPDPAPDPAPEKPTSDE